VIQALGFQTNMKHPLNRALQQTAEGFGADVSQQGGSACTADLMWKKDWGGVWWSGWGESVISPI